MRRNEFQGTRAVFRFTLAQFLKSKSTIATMAVLVVVVMASMLVASQSMQGAFEMSEVKGVHIKNTTPYAVSADDIARANPLFGGIRDVSEDAAQASITIEEESGAYIVTAVGAVSSGELSQLENAALSAFNSARAGIPNGAYTSFVQTADAYRSDEDADIDFAARFTVSYAYSILVLVLVMFSTTYIIRAIIEEKASRLVELLLVSVKPLALILGKILASMCLVLIELLVIGAGVGGALLVSTYALHSNALSAMLSSGALTAITNLNAFSVVVVVISILLGYFTFSIIGGISGACCSQTEDMNSANMAVVLLSMLGYLVSSTLTGFESSGVAVASSLIPFVSTFSAPARYLMGDIGIGVLLSSWALQAILIVALAAFGKRVYGALIMHRGNRIKLKQLFGIAKGGA